MTPGPSIDRSSNYMKSKFPRSVLIIAAIGGLLLITLFATRPNWHSPNVVVARQNLLHSTQDAPTPQTPSQANIPDTRAIPSGPLKVKFASPAPKIASALSDPTPVPVEAVVTRGDKTYQPKFYSGHSERLAVALNQTVPIRLSWPGDNLSSGVFVQAIQGGRIDSGGNSKQFALDDTKTIAFTFTPNTGPGMYQVILRRGTVEESLEFWVPTGHPGNEPPTIN